MIVAFLAILAGVSATSAQEQEGRLVDRILKPDMSLVNAAQNKQFRAADISLAGRAPSPTFYPPAKPFAKSFPAKRALAPRQVAVERFQAGDKKANISTKPHPATTDMVQVAPPVYANRAARENGNTLVGAPFAGNRPFLGQGKSQKALSDRDTPLTIEQVRELLNKNK